MPNGDQREREISVRVETKITDEERLIIDELKASMIRNETEEYLRFKKVDRRKLRHVIKKSNVVIKLIETDDTTQTNKQTNLLWQQPFGLQKKLE